MGVFRTPLPSWIKINKHRCARRARSNKSKTQHNVMAYIRIKMYVRSDAIRTMRTASCAIQGKTGSSNNNIMMTTTYLYRYEVPTYICSPKGIIYILYLHICIYLLNSLTPHKYNRILWFFFTEFTKAHTNKHITKVHDTNGYPVWINCQGNLFCSRFMCAWREGATNKINEIDIKHYFYAFLS